MKTWVPVLLALTVLAGCIDDDGRTTDGTPDVPVTPAPAWTFSLHDVGEDGPEPTLGVTSDGSIYFQALEKTMKSSDHGATWTQVSTTLSSPTTLDPMLWVDPVTDRVFSNQLYLACSYLSYSDDGGATWISNPAACGVPVNDHQKVATGPYVEGSPLAPVGGVNPVYPNVVYYAYNAIAGSRVAISVDGGLTFPYTGLANPPVPVDEGDSECAAGLHGHITAGPDGVVYIPNRSSCSGPDGVGQSGPVVARSFDNGLTWDQVLVHPDIGTSDHDKNPEVAIDVNNTLYITWPGADNRLYYAWSGDHGSTWSPAYLVTPQLGTATMPVIQAGDPGRIAMAYYAVEDPATVRGDEGRIQPPDLTNETARWNLYVTFSLNALDDLPTWTTWSLTDDPIQIGPISTNTGDAPAGSRNLLDFIDMVLDAEGRVYIAYADGCTGACATDPEATMEMSRDAQGFAAVMQSGPSLYRADGTLSPF